MAGRIMWNLMTLDGFAEGENQFWVVSGIWLFVTPTMRRAACDTIVKTLG